MSRIKFANLFLHIFNFIIWDTKSWYFFTPPTRSFSRVLTSKNLHFFNFFQLAWGTMIVYVNTLFKLFLLLVVSGFCKTYPFVSCLFIWPRNFLTPPCRDTGTEMIVKISWVMRFSILVPFTVHGGEQKQPF